MKVVALEEHFAFPNVIEAWRAADARAPGASLASFAQGNIGERLLGFGELRLSAMDAAGIDVQVLSLTTPGVQGLFAEEAVSLARESNDLLTEIVRSRPDRFGGFATLPAPAPERPVQPAIPALVAGDPRGRTHLVFDRLPLSAGISRRCPGSDGQLRNQL